jgi:cellulose synthase/poly-beta-1,6-N-acetylglucosamine synthase-like glycosyltransferase
MLGLSLATMQTMRARADANATSVQEELIASGSVGEAPLFSAVAAVLGLDFVAAVDPDRLVLREHTAAALLARPGGVRLAQIDAGQGRTLLLAAPDEAGLARLLQRLSERPQLATRLAIAAPSVLRAALISRCRDVLVDRAVNGLSDALPAFSARWTLVPWQSFVMGLAVAGGAAAAFAWPAPVLLALHLCLVAVFVPCVLLRLFATRMRRVRSPDLDALPRRDMPRYTVLVALHREADVIAELLVALGRIEWPRSKLEIKLVCEADDQETLAAIAGQRLRSCVENVLVPPGEPRTKPKALAYALQLSFGEFVALYDAEDRPHPRQLLEAWHRFRSADGALACVQAPLVVSNRGASLIARMFAFEYSGLFRAMLPFLSRNALILPLGGTSNHFRRSVLDKIGGWDPFNVTEDADLGLRLSRLGYRTETIQLPTLEAGPVRFGVWLPQRTRWFKGWAQTWLVHMRNPRRLAGELGPASFVVSQILFAGMLLSALSHPLLYVTLLIVAAELVIGDQIGLYNRALLALDLAVVGLGYVAFIAIGARSLPAGAARSLPLVAAVTPIYWLMLSLAAWRALAQLLRAPHLWEKTPHGDARGTDTPPAPAVTRREIPRRRE